MVVRRAGDVIPEVVAPVLALRRRGARKWHMPAVCPFCGNPIVTPDGEARARCTGGYACPARVREHLSHFVSRGAMDIEGLGYKTIDLLLENGMIVGPADIFSMDVDRLLAVPGWKETSVENLRRAIDAAGIVPCRACSPRWGSLSSGGPSPGSSPDTSGRWMRCSPPRSRTSPPSRGRSRDRPFRSRVDR